MARVCVIRQGYYPLDPRLRKEVEALVGAGHEVDIICATFRDQPRHERREAVAVYRIPIAHHRRGPLWYLFECGLFLVLAALLAGALHLRRRYVLVQVNSLPDSLVFAALVPRLLGARVLLDLLECLPEAFIVKYGLAPRHPVVRAVTVAEQASIRFADQVITCTEQMRARFIERGASPEKIGVILLSAGEETFDPERFRGSERRTEDFVLIYHGTLEESFGAGTVVRAVALLKEDIPALRFHIYGEGTFRPALKRLVAELGLEGRVWMSDGFVPLTELVSAIASADVGVVPTKRNSFRELTHSTKMFDYIAMRKPAIVGRTGAVEAYFGDSCFQLFDSEDEHDLARAIRELYADPALRDRLVRHATERSEPYRWIHQRGQYLDVVGRLLSPGAKTTADRRVSTREIDAA
jgi:glycosyltransferase involved in cell wall biosynthesis